MGETEKRGERILQQQGRTWCKNELIAWATWLDSHNSPRSECVVFEYIGTAHRQGRKARAGPTEIFISSSPCAAARAFEPKDSISSVHQFKEKGEKKSEERDGDMGWI